MSTQATAKAPGGHFIAAIQEMDNPKTGSKGVKPSMFKLRAPLLDQGRSNSLMAKTANMWTTLKVYASGGENGLHSHPNEDHMFIVMQGSARFFGPGGEEQELGRYEGIMLPAGAYYHFNATSEEPLVLLRVGCRVGPQDPAGRLDIDGKEMPSDSAENGRVEVKVRDGAFFE